MTNEYFAKTLGIVCELSGGHGATLYLVDGAILRPYVIYNLPSEYISGIGTVRIGSQCCGRAVEHKKPWIVTDMLTDPLFADGRDGALASPIRAAFSVPLLDGENAIGSLACHFTEPHSPTKLDIERNEVFARLFAISLRSSSRKASYSPYFVHKERANDSNLGRA